jgi:hypothetical protein
MLVAIMPTMEMPIMAPMAMRMVLLPLEADEPVPTRVIIIIAMAAAPASIGRIIRYWAMFLGCGSGMSGGDSRRMSPRGACGPRLRGGLRKSLVVTEGPCTHRGMRLPRDAC